jgi:late competence protein required for DNA uptake (superfamily II DNA/RNA helicase)
VRALHAYHLIAVMAKVRLLAVIIIGQTKQLFKHSEKFNLIIINEVCYYNYISVNHLTINTDHFICSNYGKK